MDVANFVRSRWHGKNTRYVQIVDVNVDADGVVDR